MIDWQRDVRLVPLSQRFRELKKVKEFRSKRLVVTKEDEPDILSLVSSRYKLMPHKLAVDRVLNVMRDHHAKDTTVNVASFGNGVRIWAQYSYPVSKLHESSEFSKLALSDEKQISFKPTLNLFNSYDTTWAFRICLGAQLEDPNVHLLVEDKLGTLRSNHLTNVIQTTQLADEIERMLEAGWPAIIKLWKVWFHGSVDYRTACQIWGKGFPWKSTQFPMTRWKWYELALQEARKSRSLNQQVIRSLHLARRMYEL